MIYGENFNRFPRRSLKNRNDPALGYYYWFNYHYDVNPNLRGDSRLWDFSDPISWMFMVENSRTNCRIVDDDELILMSLLNEYGPDRSTAYNANTIQWDSSFYGRG